MTQVKLHKQNKDGCYYSYIVKTNNGDKFMFDFINEPNSQYGKLKVINFYYINNERYCDEWFEKFFYYTVKEIKKRANQIVHLYNLGKLVKDENNNFINTSGYKN